VTDQEKWRRRGWWRSVLRGDGGWLTWHSFEWQCRPAGYDPPEPPEYVNAWPPLRRLVMTIRYRQTWPLKEMKCPTSEIR
jgi:hypothetical protein